ncbi:hypothetical protein ACFQD4_16790 [Subtercola frigoramans]|uniref:Uncharacterized protein n=1 Tax=Subtercola frigoramans TaxID=120298 RepID=A0ABS2L2A7_9MICO|nr:hypothetical protein [Subtercola frigoramans]MBM7471183.1 hypothetical protein [Subtercola frigoramans]
MTPDKEEQTGLEKEWTEHLGHEHGGVFLAVNMRIGARSKTVTEMVKFRFRFAGIVTGRLSG